MISVHNIKHWSHKPKCKTPEPEQLPTPKPTLSQLQGKVPEVEEAGGGSSSGVTCSEPTHE